MALTIDFPAMVLSFLALESRVACASIAALVAGAALAQTAQPAMPDSAPATTAAMPSATPGADAFPALAWLEGCWRGSITQREYNEHWLPPRGQMMIGASHTAIGERTQSFEYLRIEARPDGVYYIAAPSGKKEVAFQLVEQSVDTANGRNDQVFTFANPTEVFPRKIIYRRATEGWLYATVEGKVGGADKQLVYPLRRIGCESGELLLR